MSKTQLTVRNATLKDIQGIIDLTIKVYKNMAPYSKEEIRAQIRNFRDGNLVVLLNDKIVGYSASIILPEKKVLRKHTWQEITGSGYGSTHDEDGDYLYGYETCVDPDVRGNKIGQRIYNMRIELVKFLRLKGIVFGGRVPNYRRRKKDVKDIHDYIDKVIHKKIKDPTLGFHLRNGFEVIGVLDKYLDDDLDSMGFAVHLRWLNSEFQANQSQKAEQLLKSSVRVVTVQYKLRRIDSFDEFSKAVEYYVDVASDYNADFVLFPELFTMQLLSIKNEEVAPNIAIEHMTEYTERIKEMFQSFAVKYNVNIIGGSHPTLVDGRVLNISYIALRDGSLHEQPKIHPTPDERYWWNIEGGDEVKVIDTDCGPIGVSICYDSEFPEVARHLVNQGINILFVPFLTDNRQAYCRVRYCSQARAVENQIYVALAGNVGHLPLVENVDIQYAQSCILTPCDFAFASDGIAAETTPNVEMVAIADLRLDTLMEARSRGAVRPIKDRRHDLYSVKWHKKPRKTSY